MMMMSKGECSATYSVMLERYKPAYKGAANLAQVARIGQRRLVPAFLLVGVGTFAASVFNEGERHGDVLLYSLVLLGLWVAVSALAGIGLAKIRGEAVTAKEVGRLAASLGVAAVVGVLVLKFLGHGIGATRKNGYVEDWAVQLPWLVGVVLFVVGALLSFISSTMQSRLDATVFQTPGLSDDEKLALVTEVRAGLVIAPSAAVAHADASAEEVLP